MLTPADDYPLHQSSRPLRDAGSERNLYDRYFFNGHSPDGETFFAVAFGQYPGRNVMDGAFSVSVATPAGRVQHNVRGSRALGDDRLDTQVGPIRVELVEPLHRLRVVVEESGSGVSADLLFTSRTVPIEEPHYLLNDGYRTSFDYTRLTQSGAWSGSITLPGGEVRDVAEGWRGSRDRSWGVRAVGEREAGGGPGRGPFGFFWLWAPMQFEDWSYLFDVTEHPDGRRWHEGAMGVPVGGAADDVESGRAGYRFDYRPGTRHARAFGIELHLPSGSRSFELEPLYPFFMQGIGYMHPEWGHGVWKGPLASTYDTLDVDGADLTSFENLHIQAVSRIRRDDGATVLGVLEQLVIGPHRPSGLEGFEMHG